MYESSSDRDGGRWPRNVPQQFLLKVLLYVLASPFIGVAVFSAFLLAVVVGCWVLYGVAFWITGFFWVASLFMEFSVYTANPPMVALFPSMMAGLACHLASVSLVIDKLTPDDPLLM